MTDSLPEIPRIAGFHDAFRSAKTVSQRSQAHTYKNKKYLSEHVVHFYETDAMLLDTLSSFIGEGLREQHACVVLATPSHRLGLEQRLDQHGLHLASARRRGTYIACDAAEMLAQIMTDGLPDARSFVQTVGQLLERVNVRQQPVHIFGEMVALLRMDRQQTAMIQLEMLWHTIRAMVPPFVLLCGYPKQECADEANAAYVHAICQQHEHLLPDESSSPQVASQMILSSMVRAQQQVIALQAERERRELAELRLHRWEEDYRYLFDASLEGSILVDGQSGVIVNVNQFVLELTGCSRAEVLGLELWQLGLFVDRTTMLTALHELAQKRLLRYRARELHLMSQRHRPVEISMTSIYVGERLMAQCSLRAIVPQKD